MRMLHAYVFDSQLCTVLQRGQTLSTGPEEQSKQRMRGRSKKVEAVEMQHKILYRERYNGDGREVVYVKSADDLAINKVEPTAARALGSKITVTWIVRFLKEVFLPQGFPDSVHADYVPYQIWDTVQAFASTIMGTLTTHSIMQGVGVGDTSATALAAAITWILKDGTGMIGRIVFAWWNGPGLDAQCKKWRLFADILNDCAMGIELTLPYFPNYSLVVLCLSTAMKSIVGVAGSATRAALTQHQALKNNLADVSAKDGSQETFVNLIASFVGIMILSNIGDGRYVMELFVLLATVHLYANYRAVRALCLNSLNEDRLALILRNYLVNRTVPDPAQVNKFESVLLGGDTSRTMFGFGIRMGVSMERVFKNDAFKPGDILLLSKQFRNRKYLIVLDVKRKEILVPIARDTESSEVLQAYFHACLYALITCMRLKVPIDILLEARSHKPSYPLLRMYLLYKKYLPLGNDTLTGNSVIMTVDMDEVVVKEFRLFLVALEKNVWVTRMNLLPVGPWRGSWDHRNLGE